MIALAAITGALIGAPLLLSAREVLEFAVVATFMAFSAAACGGLIWLIP